MLLDVSEPRDLLYQVDSHGFGIYDYALSCENQAFMEALLAKAHSNSDSQ